MPDDFGALVRHEFPDGTEAFSRESDHSYWREAVERKGEWGGKGRLTGMSSVVKPSDWSADALMEWAAKSNGTGIALLAADALALDDQDAMRDALSFLRSGDAIWQALTEAELTFEDLREARAKEGTAVHKHALHALATGSPVPDFAKLTEEERGFAQGVVAFWHDTEPEPSGAEQVVADLELGVAGKLDVRCSLLADGVRQTALVDAKTGYVSKKAHFQVAGYEACSVACGHDPTDGQLILRVRGDGTYELIPVQADREDFAASVDLYRRAGRVDTDAKRAWRATQLELAA